MNIHVERVYEFRKRNKQAREYAVLVDRVWPRGISKDALAMDEWTKELAPSSELRQWFGHDPGKWKEFVRRYRRELEPQADKRKELLKHARGGRLTLLYSSRDESHNQAVALREWLQE